MKANPLGILALLTLVTTVVWLVLMISGIVSAGPLDTFDQVIAQVGKLDALHYAVYINAGLLTLVNMLFFTALYQRYKAAAPFEALLGLLFIPVYGGLNLLVYLSQVTVVPALLDQVRIPEFRASAVLGLQMLLQNWPGSMTSFANVLAYALLGISSILFATIINREEQRPRELRMGIFLLELNGAACIIGLIGLIYKNPLMMSGTALGGVFFLAALLPLTIYFLKK